MALLRILASAVKTKPQVEVYGKLDTMDLHCICVLSELFSIQYQKLREKGVALRMPSSEGDILFFK